MTAITTPWQRRASGLLRTGLDFVYPPACARCGRPPDRGPLPFADASPRLCAPCAAEVAPPLADRCERCSAPVGPHLDTTRGCVHCRSDRFAFDRVVSLGVWDGPLRAAVLEAKRQAGDTLAAALAELLWQREAEWFRSASIDLLVPVPHHWSERLFRRHLTPASFGRALHRKLRVRWADQILLKIRRTPQQARLTDTQRRANLRGAFRVGGGARLTGLTILLVDDVLTTGTTAHRASLPLKAAGAERILVAVAARGLGLKTGETRLPLSHPPANVAAR